MLLKRAALLLFSLAQLALCAEDYYKVSPLPPSAPSTTHPAANTPKLLGIDREADDRSIKSAYRRLSKKYHPDKNPNDPTAKDKFVEVSSAYEALIDPELRRIYNQHGHEGVERHKESGGAAHRAHDPFDLFSQFFGGRGHFDAQEKRGPSAELRVGVSLRDLYNGAETELSWERQHICGECDGTGSADGVVEECPHCGGHGIRVVKRQLAPGMFQQLQTPCDACGQRGKTVRNKCPACNGARVVRRPTPLDLKVPRGAPPEFRIVYENEADAHPDHVAGDIHVVLVEKTPGAPEDNPDGVDGAFFRRKGDDLFWDEVLSLREAWMGGWSRNITHLDGHVVRLGRPRGEVVQPGRVDTVKGEGMPRYHEDGDSVYHQTEFGDLQVQYTVVLPDQMEGPMEEEFWGVFEKWRGKVGVDLEKDSGRPAGTEAGAVHDEL